MKITQYFIYTYVLKDFVLCEKARKNGTQLLDRVEKL
jgi:hypothetical protein